LTGITAFLFKERVGRGRCWTAMSLAPNAIAVAQLTVTVPTDGDSGPHSIAVDAAASGAHTAVLSADLDHVVP
jgi:hypothetical protein